MCQGSLQSVDSEGRTGCGKTGVRTKGTTARVRGIGAEPVEQSAVSSSVAVRRGTMVAARSTRISTIAGSCTRCCLVNNWCAGPQGELASR